MNNYYFTEKKEKNKHLSLKDYQKIQSEYNYYIFSKEKKKKKTQFMKKLANSINTTLSNLYVIIKSGSITVLNSDLTERIEFSAEEAYKKRTKK